MKLFKKPSLKLLTVHIENKYSQENLISCGFLFFYKEFHKFFNYY